MREEINTKAGLLSWFKNTLIKPVDGTILGFFRIVFGVFMIIEMIKYINMDLVKNAYILPVVKLPYFEFLKALPEPVMKLMLAIMLICAILIAAGVFFRYACIIFGSFYLYFFLLEKSIYNNHIYLFITLAFLLPFTHADDFLSFKKKDKDKPLFQIQFWEIFLIQLQFAIVYFYGGLVKLGPEWLIRMEPATSMVNSFQPDHVLYFFYSNPFQIPLLTYGGVLFDLLIPFAFWYKPTRKWALIPAFFFHISNSLVFDDIGIFPFIMIFSTAIFFPIDEIPILRNFKALPVKKTLPVPVTSSMKKNVLLGIITFQLLFPFRGFLLPANMDWTSVGNSFSWRMKIQTRKIEKLAFTIQDGPEGQALNVQMNTFINPMQALVVVKDARAVLVCANAIAQEGRKKGMKDPIVKAQILIGWNGRKPVYFVDPEVDLTKQHYEIYGDNPWLTPKPD